MLSLRCRINANVAELLVIIGYSELGPTLGARPFALHPGLSLASSPVWSFSRLPRCRGSHWRASRWTVDFTPGSRRPGSFSTETEQLSTSAARSGPTRGLTARREDPTPLTMLFTSLFPTRCFSPRRRRESAPWACEERERSGRHYSTK